MKITASKLFIAVLFSLIFFVSSCSGNGNRIKDSTGKPVSCKDGVFKASLPLDSYNYIANAEVTIKDQKITAIVYYEKQEGTGQIKDENYYSKSYTYIKSEKYSDEWFKTAQTAVKGTMTYPEQLLANQNVKEVDVVTGATFSYGRFIEVVDLALKSAKK